MKKYLLFLTSSLLLLLNASAKIWRVNNTGVPADFTSPQTAVNSASVQNGDTLHIEASGASYAGLVITKQLVIIGNGYLHGTLGGNANPDLQANPAPSLLGNVTINTGSSGTVLEGLTLANGLLITGGVSNIIIRRNRLNSVTFGLCNNVQLVQNYLDMSTTAQITYDGNPATNLQIYNNVIAFHVNLGSGVSGDFMNNIIGAVSVGTNALSNFRVWNNICRQGNVTLTSCDSRSNIGNSTQFGTLNGNQQSVNMTTVFEDVPNTDPNFSEDSRWQLKAGSPAIGVAWNGTVTSGDCGVYGSSATGTAYVISGVPNVPSIYKLSAPAVTTSNTLNITISTRTNN